MSGLDHFANMKKAKFGNYTLKTKDMEKTPTLSVCSNDKNISQSLKDPEKNLSFLKDPEKNFSLSLKTEEKNISPSLNPTDRILKTSLFQDDDKYITSTLKDFGQDLEVENKIEPSFNIQINGE